jgi:peptidyl-prolyl cis-trans isomerase D
MALIGKIRERSGLVLLLITLAVAGFVIMDMTSAGPGGNKVSLFNNPNQLGKVNGTAINRNDVERARSILYENGDYLSSTNTVWNFFVEKAIVEQETKALGMGVSKDELLNAQFSLNPAEISPIVQSRFMDQTSGQLNIELLQQYKAAIENGDINKNPEIVAYWAEQEKEIIKERLQSKMTNFVAKGFYTPKWMAEMAYNDQNTKIDAIYTRLPFTAVPDAEAQVTDEDIKKYIEDNKSAYYREREGRKISYATFTIVPLAADSMRARKTIADMVAEFRAAKSDSIFVSTKGGEISDAYETKSSFTGGADSLFSKPIGSIVGPYVNNGAYNVSKILGRTTVADSVKARHILLKGQSPKFIDSVFTALKAGKVSWDTLNQRYSTDKVSAAKGGDLGFFGPGMMVKPFNDLCFYKAEQGKYYTVETQFGTHIIQVTGKKFIKNEQGVKLATISEPIETSEETVQSFRDRASGLIQRNKKIADLKKEVESLNMTFESSQPVEKGDYLLGQLGGNNGTRAIIKWANEASVGAVADQVFEIQNTGDKSVKLAVAALKSILPAGLPKPSDVKDEVIDVVKNRKKGEVLAAKIANNKDVVGLASQYQAKVDTARQMTYSANFVPGIGQEPRVIGNIFAMEQGGTTNAIVGNGGVYVANVVSKTAAVPSSDLTQLKNQLNQMARGQVRGRLVQGMKNKANLKDNRD